MANPSAIAAAEILFAKEVVRNLYANNEWLKESTDHSSLAVGKTVNVINRGTTKTVINGTTVSLTPTDSGDSVKSYQIDEYQTVPTKIPFSEEILTSHENRQEIMYDHEEHFKVTMAERTLYNWCPTHTLLTTGIVKSAAYGTGTRKKTTKADVDRLNQYLTKQNVPAQGRCLLVSAEVHADLLSIDEFINMDYVKNAPTETGMVGMIAGFKVYLRSRTLLKEIAVNATEGNHNPQKWLEDNSATERTVGDTATDTIIAWHPRYVSTALNSNTLVSVIPVHGGVEVSLTAVGGGSKLSNSGIGVVSMCETVVTAPAA